MALLQWLPVLFIVVLASVSTRRSRLAPLVYAILLLVNVLTAAAGAALVLLDLARPKLGDVLPMPANVDQRSLGFVLFGTGLLATIVLLPGVRRVLARVMRIDAESPVHATALALAVYYLGFTAATILLAGGLEGLAASSVPQTPMGILESGAALVLIAMFGVGFLIYRRPSDTVRRLGLAIPKRNELVAVVIITLGFLALDFTVSFAWSRFDPGGYATQVRITQALFGARTSVLLALAIALSAGVGEEVLMRGALQPRFGLVATAAFFALGHQQYGFTPALAEVFTVGLVLGVVRNRANTTTCILIHFLYNLLDLLLAPLFP